jgi:hypothetical protein
MMGYKFFQVQKTFAQFNLLLRTLFSAYELQDSWDVLVKL